MKSCLFIDRDGTLIKEPADEQVDSLKKLEFLPGALRALYHIANELDFELVMVTNQDGLGTASFPEKDFWLVQNKMVQILANEGITFSDVCIDKSFPHENLPTRKPGTGMLKKYMEGDYDLSTSFTIGDRTTDVQLAKNLEAKAILIGDESRREELAAQGLSGCCALVTQDWMKIYEFLKCETRTAKVARTTAETDVCVQLDLDGSGASQISTGLHFLDHMLEQIARHSGCNLSIAAKGDLHVDEHHLIEDVGIVLGEAIYKALGSKRGIERYGFVLPMDDCLAQVALDFGGRSWLIFDADFKREKVGDFPTEMIYHFFKSLSDAAKMNLNIKAEGDNEHHKLEAIFKALARAVKAAVRRDALKYDLPSTKGKVE
ncbi:MAG: bifunctional histidinol-phosphatase/imidazoleglycerol-phosphate dehydratase HisB [Prevotellaceae bacterium]|jgi:imidazoleglycerol-phosphate dehydratase/histidinol-phosphatase|nr:bifunctional histidinol-phosphatase/imidazoleglycerol-phosphate dehydratase HisB [Prevotellaceae bacterium]